MSAASPTPALEAWPPAVETWLMPFFRETSLWPVLFALFGHVVVVLVPLMLWAVRDHSLPALLALGWFGFLTVKVARADRRCEGRYTAVSGSLAITWAGSVVVAAITGPLGVL